MNSSPTRVSSIPLIGSIIWLVGGLWKLIGTLYELLVAQALVIRAADPDLEFGSNLTAFSVFGDVDGENSQILLQYCLTDAIVVNPDNLIIIQCKASASPESNPIQLNELKQILVDGAKHLRSLRAQGDPRPVQQFVLISNRPLSPALSSLNDEVRGIDTDDRATATCPDRLLSTGGGRQTVSQWCSELADAKRNLPGGGHPTIDSDLAEYAAELVMGFRYASLKEDECQRLFRVSLQQLGLTENEIDDAEHELKSRLLLAARNNTDISEALRAKFFDTGSFHTLCAPQLALIEEQTLESHWQLSGLGETIETAVQHGLPRLKLIETVHEMIDSIINRIDTRIPILVGDGGVGKTQLIFQLPPLVRNLDTRSDQEHLFAIADGFLETDSIDTIALKPFFAGYTYSTGNGKGHVERIRRAFQVCRGDTHLWILVPNSDQLTTERLQQLIGQLILRRSEGVTYVLTARTMPWDNIGRVYAPSILNELKVGDLDRFELYQWFAKWRVYQSTESSVGIATRPGTVAVPMRHSGDSIRAGYLDHALSFRAFRNWALGTDNIIEQQFRLSSFLDGHLGAVSAFMASARNEYCQRVAKHCQPLDISVESIEVIFDRIWLLRDELGELLPRDWVPRLCENIADNPRAREVILQFIQIGVLTLTDQRSRTLAWKVPFTSQVEVA